MTLMFFTSPNANTVTTTTLVSQLYTTEFVPELSASEHDEKTIRQWRSSHR